jgi:hypothetical protein
MRGLRARSLGDRRLVFRLQQSWPYTQMVAGTTIRSKNRRVADAYRIAQRRRPRDALIATVMHRRLSLQRIVEMSFGMNLSNSYSISHHIWERIGRRRFSSHLGIGIS